MTEDEWDEYPVNDGGLRACICGNEQPHTFHFSSGMPVRGTRIQCYHCKRATAILDSLKAKDAWNDRHVTVEEWPV